MRFFFFEWQIWVKAVKQNIPWKNKGVPYPSTFSILCVDDDRKFFLYVQRLASKLDIEIDSAFSIKEAKRKIEQGKKIYHGCMIDGHLPDGSGFDLIAWIRKNKQKKIPIVFLSRFYRDATSFRILKEEWQVDYVLEKPLTPTQVEQVLKNLCELIRLQRSAVSSDGLDLKQKDQQHIFNQLARLQTLILILQKNPFLEDLQALINEIHQIGTSAESEGNMKLSELCKIIEKQLTEQQILAQEGFWDLRALNELDEFFREIKSYFQ